jgi:hypothetical protein
VDINHGGHISQEEFLAAAIRYPSLVNCLRIDVTTFINEVVPAAQ